MFATLPDFTPRDSHSLWYTSSRSPFQIPGPLDAAHNDSTTGSHGQNNPRQRGQLEKTALARLAADEQYMNRRRINVQNLGSGWLKPPGVTKTLHQLREEKREQEDHQEAMRREQLAAELAEAEAADMPEDGMDDVQLDGAQDLDDEIPDAEDEFGLDEDEEDEEDAEDEEGDENVVRAGRENDLITARMRMTDDAFREALVRGDPDGDDMYGSEEELQEEDEGHILDEDDFVQEGLDEDGMGVDMDADLDDDIPEAESVGYEHTDSEAEVSSDEEDSEDDEEDDDGQGVGFAPRTAPLGPPQSPTQRGRMSTGTRQSMDLSNILDESSFMNSSPAQGR